MSWNGSFSSVCWSCCWTAFSCARPEWQGWLRFKQCISSSSEPSTASVNAQLLKEFTIMSLLYPLRGRGGAYFKGVEGGAYYKFWALGGALIRSGALIWSWGLIWAFTVNGASNATNFSPRFCVYKWVSSLFTAIVFKFHKQMQTLIRLDASEPLGEQSEPF